MKKKFLKITFLGFLIIIVAISCGKDKPLTSETTEVSTTKNGSVYKIDTLNSKIEWKGYKIVKTENMSHFGIIKFESGDITVKDNKLESGKFVADINTLENVDLRDNQKMQNKLTDHLKSADFFEVEKFPTASYEITKISENKNQSDYNTILDGNLTIKGITKPIQFNANVSVNNENVSIATEPKDIKREDFGLKFQLPLENGVLNKDITLQILLKAMESK